ncbi:MAG: branched-chain amino acid ABC transporter permease [Pikeienuella sp.]
MTRKMDWRIVGLWFAFAVIMLLLPELAKTKIIKTSTLRTIIWAQYLAIFAMSWDFLSGRTGYISFGHPFLIGIGAYTTAILSYRFNVPMGISIPVAVLVTVLASSMFILPALRIRGSYFALVTLAFMELLYQLTQVVRPDLTGGTRGISGVETMTRGAVNGFYVSFALMFCVALTLWLLNRTRLGSALSAIGMNEDAVSGLGLNTTKLKLFAFVVSAAVAGLGGAFYVHYLGSVAPRALFDINFVFTIIVAALIGGSGTIIGPMFGAFLLTFLLEYLRLLASPGMIASFPPLEYVKPVLQGSGRYFIYGMIALVLYMYQPKGVAYIVRNLRKTR